MTRPEDLTTFVREALTRGVARPEIERSLLQAGWSAKQARDALAGFAEVPFPIPVPRPRPYTEARDTFLHALLFLALALCAYHLGMLIFRFIDAAFPPPGVPEGLRRATRWPVSVLIVTLPVLVYVSHLVNRDIRRDPDRRASKSRIQTIYLTLFSCAAVVIGVLAGLVYNFLGGELTIRFILKSLTAAAIAAAIFAYYRRDLRVEPAEAAG